MLQKLLHFDVFRVLQDRESTLTPPTNRGGVLSIICVFLIVVGVANESLDFFFLDWRSSMVLTDHNFEKETVHFNISFVNFPCHTVVFDAIEANTGRVYEEQMKTLQMTKFRLLQGTIRLDEYKEGPTPFGEGCLVEGTFQIDKVPGHFTIVSQQQQYGGTPLPSTDFIVHGLWFGEKRVNTKDVGEELVNALAGYERRGDGPRIIYQFFISIVPTEFDDGRIAYQYTATESHMTADIAPGLYFHHLHSPISVLYQRSTMSWTQYLTNLCAVAGGVFTFVGFGVSLANRMMAPLITLYETFKRKAVVVA